MTLVWAAKRTRRGDVERGAETSSAARRGDVIGASFECFGRRRLFVGTRKSGWRRVEGVHVAASADLFVETWEPVSYGETPEVWVAHVPGVR